MTNVYLHGKLGKVFGEKHKFMVSKPIDAIKALMANKKNFKKAFKTWGKEGKFYEIICDERIIENENELLNPRKIKDIHICPVVLGAGGSGNKDLAFLQIVVGVLLIATGVGLAGGFANLSQAGFGAQLAFNLGVGFVVGGAMSLLFPPPVPSFQSSVQSKSYLFSSLENSTVQGEPIPVGYGRLRIGSKIIETSLTPKDIGSDTIGGTLAARATPTIQDIRRGGATNWGNILDP